MLLHHYEYRCWENISSYSKWQIWYDDKHSAKSYQPEKNELIKLEKEMQNVWNASVRPHEKVKQFTEELKKFRSLLKTMTEPV